MDSEYDGKAFDVLQSLIFKLLLTTDGRTTDLLEALLNENIVVSVLRQERIGVESGDRADDSSGAGLYVRESVLQGARSGFLVSHNIALVDAKHVPPALFEKIALRQEGIGKAMSSLGLPSFRKVADAGRIDKEKAFDLFGKPLALRFPEPSAKVPYKKYAMYFGPEPGIRMLEYYHPKLVEHRLQQAVKNAQ